MVDYRRTMLGYVPQDYLAGYAPGGPALQAFIDDLRPVLQGRLPGPEVTPDQLRDRSWWSGPEIFVLVDDYDMVASPSGNPIAGLAEFLPQAKDVGLHLVVCRRTGGAARALFEPIIQRIRELGSPGIDRVGQPRRGSAARHDPPGGDAARSRGAGRPPLRAAVDPDRRGLTARPRGAAAGFHNVPFRLHSIRVCGSIRIAAFTTRVSPRMPRV